jgi:hypothetical protein
MAILRYFYEVSFNDPKTGDRHSYRTIASSKQEAIKDIKKDLKPGFRNFTAKRMFGGRAVKTGRASVR